MQTSFFGKSKEIKPIIVPNEEGKNAYALYLQQSESLVFVRSDETPKAGYVYAGEIVTEVFSDFERKKFERGKEPWSHLIGRINSVKVENQVDLDISNMFDGYSGPLQAGELSKMSTDGITKMTPLFKNSEKLQIK